MCVDVGQEAPCVVMWVHVCGCGAGGPISVDVGQCVDVGQEAPCGAGCSMWVHVAPYVDVGQEAPYVWMWGRAFHVGPCGSGGPMWPHVG